MSCIMSTFYKSVGTDVLLNKKHTHDNCYEIIQIWTDNGQFMINDTIYSMKKGMIYLIDSSSFHCAAPSNESEYIRSKIILSKSEFNQLAQITDTKAYIDNLFSDGGGAVLLETDAILKADSLFQKLHCEFSSDKKYFDQSILLLNLFQTIIDFNTAQSDDMDERLKVIFTAINEHLSEDISINELSWNIHLNKYYMCHFFKEKTNMTIMEYIRLRRIAEAKKRLVSTQISISNIGLEVGFSNMSYFSKTFKRETGFSPKDYRKFFK